MHDLKGYRIGIPKVGQECRGIGKVKVLLNLWVKEGVANNPVRLWVEAGDQRVMVREGVAWKLRDQTSSISTRG